MRVEEMALRSEIRQMLNEAGFNKDTIKDLVKETLRDEIKRAVNQAIHESAYDVDSYVKLQVKSILNDSVDRNVKKILSDKAVGRYFDRMHISVEVTPIMDLIDKEGDNND